CCPPISAIMPVQRRSSSRRSSSGPPSCLEIGMSRSLLRCLLFLTFATDGTVRTGTPTTVQVQPGRSAVVKAAGTFRGLVELSGGGELRYSARLAGTGPGRLGVYLPAITSDNMIAAGQAVALQGLLSGSGRATDLAL